MDILTISTEKSSKAIEMISNFLDEFPELKGMITTIDRWVFVILALSILLRSILSLLKSRKPSEIWAYVQDDNNNTTPLSHWENIIGRSRTCDIICDDPSVSRSHGTLMRNNDGSWTYTDLTSSNGSYLNGRRINGQSVIVKIGDVLSIGSCNLTLFPISLEEDRNNTDYRRRNSIPLKAGASFATLTVFQLLTALQLIVSLGKDCPVALPLSMIGLCMVMWLYYVLMLSLKRMGFEMEIIAFFLSTLSLAVTASAEPESVLKQLVAIILGLILFFALCWYLRDLDRAKKIRVFMVGAAILLLLINLIFGTSAFGAQNWISIGGLSIQPSELVKIAFIYAGAATLDELYTRKNLTLFIALSVFCLLALTIMSDFGTASIFFVAFLVISFLRSGDFSKLILVSAAALTGIILMLRFKPYIADRFSAWGHVWELADSAGFQQTRSMSAAASGGLVGVGTGNGWLNEIFAAETDLVFGVLTEEWGLLISSLAVLSIVTLCVFAFQSIISGRSTFYTIAACSASTMFIFQTMLNIFGCVDLLPLTGVTFPFVSCGGSSMLASWGLLSFMKAADTRQNASFAVIASGRTDLNKPVNIQEPDDSQDYQEVKSLDDLF